MDEMLSGLADKEDHRVYYKDLLSQLTIDCDWKKDCTFNMVFTKHKMMNSAFPNAKNIKFNTPKYLKFFWA